jgi:thioredoxin reductase
VTWIDDSVLEARAVESKAITSPHEVDEEFEVVLAGGERRRARRLVLATGIVDELPAIPGLAERWGTAVFHCPYCHGYELDGGPVAVLATLPSSVHHAMMLPDWGPTTYFTQGVLEPDDETRGAIEARGVVIERAPVRAIGGDRAVEVTLDDGRVLGFAGLFLAPRTRVSSPIAAQLGCELEEGPLGAYLRCDAMRATTVPGVFACGDITTFAGSVAIAVADGVRAGVAAHHSLIVRAGQRAA